MSQQQSNSINSLDSLLDTSDSDFGTTPQLPGYEMALGLIKSTDEHLKSHSHPVYECSAVSGAYRILNERKWEIDKEDSYYAGLFAGFTYSATLLKTNEDEADTAAKFLQAIVGINSPSDLLLDFALAMALLWREKREGIDRNEIFYKYSSQDEVDKLVELFNKIEG